METLPVRQRDIVLVPFSFSNQRGEKVRPALVVSNDAFNASSEDVVACAVTSALKPGRYTLFVDQSNLEHGQLFKQSAIKAESLVKIEKTLIVKTIAAVNARTYSKVIDLICKLVSS